LLIYRNGQTDVIYGGTNTVAAVQKDTHSCKCAEGHTHFLI